MPEGKKIENMDENMGIYDPKKSGQVPLVLCGLKKPNIINQLLNILCKKK